MHHGLTAPDLHEASKSIALHCLNDISLRRSSVPLRARSSRIDKTSLLSTTHAGTQKKTAAVASHTTTTPSKHLAIRLHHRSKIFQPSFRTTASHSHQMCINQRKVVVDFLTICHSLEFVPDKIQVQSVMINYKRVDLQEWNP